MKQGSSIDDVVVPGNPTVVVDSPAFPVKLWHDEYVPEAHVFGDVIMPRLGNLSIDAMYPKAKAAPSAGDKDPGENDVLRK